MIIVKLMGGLGNQMFQYAAGRRLAHIHNVPLKLDLSWFSNIEKVNTARRYELHIFNITADTASPAEVARFKKDRLSAFPNVLKKIINAANLLHNSKWIREKHYHFDPSILELPDNVYLEGFWQSEKYFSDIGGVIRKEFTVKIEPVPLNRQTAEAILRSEAVSVHVRRGDYVLNPSTSEFHGICSLEYYMKAIENIAARVERPHFYFFSDEPEWVRENLVTGYPATFIDHNGPDKAYEDMRLMSLCKHHVIANSSFSWWGAWLCENHEKIVIAPKKWFNKEDMNTKDLIPEKWIKM